MKITAENIQGWACRGSRVYLATMYPDGVEVDEPFLRRWARGEEWEGSHWTDLARAAVQVDPSIVACLNPSLAPYVGTVTDEATADAAAKAAKAAVRAARAEGRETARGRIIALCIATILGGERE